MDDSRRSDAHPPNGVGEVRYPSGHDTSTPPNGELNIADLPRTELDTLLAQLMELAGEVLATQSRLQGLLRASQVINEDLSLPAVLRHIVEAAREVIGARCAGLGVIAPEGGLAGFVHVGMDASTVEAIGGLPQGKGLLGALIDDPVPIRSRSGCATWVRTGAPRGSRRGTRRWGASWGCRSGSGARCSATCT